MAVSTPLSTFGQFPAPGCGATVHYHLDTHTHLGPNCNLAEVPDCEGRQAPYRPSQAHSEPERRQREEVSGLAAHVAALAVGTAIAALGSAALLGAALMRYLG